MLVILGQNYWEIAKVTSLIILKLLLRHLPILIIGKGLLETSGDALALRRREKTYDCGSVPRSPLEGGIV